MRHNNNDNIATMQTQQTDEGDLDKMCPPMYNSMMNKKNNWENFARRQ